MHATKKTDTPVRLMDRSLAAGCAAKIPPQILAGLLNRLPVNAAGEERLLTRNDSNEDAAVVVIPPDMALVQTLDFFTPIVNDPFAFGQIAAANALSDVYAMGGEPWCAMNIVCFPVQDMPSSVLEQILAGGASKLEEARCALAGGHSVNDKEVKYGLSVTGIVSPKNFAANTNLEPGQVLMLTKPLGTGLISTAVKVGLDGADELEQALISNAARLNAGAGLVIRKLRLKAATDITGFGLGGHALEMAEASRVDVYIQAEALPLLPRVLELAEMGLLPAGSHANTRYRMDETIVRPEVNPFRLDIVFDAQTSGGILMALAPQDVDAAKAILEAGGDVGHVIGSVREESGGPRLHIV
jgi:selenide,water dikinase